MRIEATMKTTTELLPVSSFMGYMMLGCGTSAAPDISAFDATVVDIVNERWDDSALDIPQQDASADTPSIRDVPTDVVTDLPSFDPDDAGPCDPRRVRAANSGRVCWPRNPDHPDVDCPAGGRDICQLGVCCTGIVDPVTCECRCPGRTPCNESLEVRETCCFPNENSDPRDVTEPFICSHSCGSLAEERYWTEWAARRDR